MPENNPALMTIFAEALERKDPAARESYLDRVCGNDAALRQRVEALLAAHDGAGRFLECEATGLSEPTIPETQHATGMSGLETVSPPELATDGDVPGDRPATLGYTPSSDRSGGFVAGQIIAHRYTLLDVLGEGGMGTVYRAEQSQPVRRQVALKLIKIGMDSRTVLARFDAERQALALMDHPNIARVYDGGTTAAGQPFFVMELVNGPPITEYCDAKRLSVRARLELFVAVCQAVQHAHQKGIIHRDLKPNNILVTDVDGRPTPKVIDFGVAKATEFNLTDLSLADTGAIVGTPTYMSPEQADPTSMDIDTRTDVYALGVILYELLAGSPPIDAKQFTRGAILEMFRMVREVDPPRPSTRVSTSEALPSIAASRDVEPAHLKRALKGDLDWIVMKSLEKDRTRRYETANGFAADVLRHLAHEAVLAAPPSRAYRLRKFVRKHRGAVIAASFVLLALLGGIVGTTWGLIRADIRRAEAEKARTAEAERVKERDAAVTVADARADELKYRLGVSEFLLASEAYEDGDVILAADRLDNVPAEQRGWEWGYLKQLTRGGLFTLYGHTDEVNAVSFSPDGTRIVTGSGDHTARVWDARTGTQILVLKGHTRGVTSAAFSPDGTRFVTGSIDRTAKVWDARTGKQQLELRQHTRGVLCVSFSPDGTRIVTGSTDDTAKVWDARTGKRLLDLIGHTHLVLGVAFSPDGKQIVTCGDGGSVKLWDARTGSPLFDLKGHKVGVQGVSFSPNGMQIVTAGGEGTGKVWDARTGAALLDLKGHRFAMMSAVFSPDGTRIVTGSNDKTSKVWDARTGLPMLELKGHTATVTSAGFSRDGALVVTASEDGTAKVWDGWTAAPAIQLKGHQSTVTNAKFSPDGTRIVTAGGDKMAKVWDARTGTPLLDLKGQMREVHSASFSPDGTRIVTAGGNSGRKPGVANVWDARAGTPLFNLKGRTVLVASAAFSPDGSRVATGGGDPYEPTKPGEVIIWDGQTGMPLLQLKGHTGGVWSVSFSPDGTRIVTGNTDGAAKVWDARTGTPELDLKGHLSAVIEASFSADGTRIVTGSWDKMAKVWDARTGTHLLDLKGHTLGVAFTAFSPDGTRIVTGSGDGTARIWDARTGMPLLELKRRSIGTSSISFSPDGTRIVTNDGEFGEPGEAKVWDARTGSLPIELEGYKAPLTSLSFSLDGERIVAASPNETAKVWDARTGEELKGAPIPAVQPPGLISPDGRSIAHQAGDRVALVPLQPDAEEVSDRLIRTQPKSWLYRERYEAAIKTQDNFAARFYLNLFPRSEQALIKAEAIVVPLFARLLIRDDVLDALQAQPAGDPEIQAASLKLAKTRSESAEYCNIVGWRMVRNPGQPDAIYLRGLRLAEAACRLEPENGLFLNTLGIGQYRTGRIAEALATLTRSNDLNKQEEPGDLAFLALAQHRLGQSEKARFTLGRLREVMKDSRWAENNEAQAFVREAELIDLDRVFPANPFAR